MGVFVYYFIGSVVSRIGSLLVEPLFRKLNVVTFAAYEDFVRASKVDPKLEILSEANNMYRTICALMMVIGVVALYEYASAHWAFLITALPWVLIIFLFVLYLFSYRKQVAYITKRIVVSKS